MPMYHNAEPTTIPAAQGHGDESKPQPNSATPPYMWMSRPASAQTFLMKSAKDQQPSTLFEITAGIN